MNTLLRCFRIFGFTLLILATWQLTFQNPWTSVAESSEKRITTEKEFRTKVVEKKLTNERGALIIHKDGNLTGKLGRRELSGKWTWEDGYFCRTIALGDRQLPGDCQKVTIEGDEVTFYRKKGSSDKGFLYQIDSE